MTSNPPRRPGDHTGATALSRRALLASAAAFATVSSLARPHLAAAQAATPPTAPVDPAALQRLTDLSLTLCGGGNLDPDRATMLLGLLTADSALHQGLDELLATPPPSPSSPVVPSPNAQDATEAILLFWYTGTFNGAPVPNRATAYYQLIAWQAMYTPPAAVCKAFGGWADPPRLTPLVANS
jgi:hypothetical protein